MNQNTTRSMVLSRRVCLRLLLNRNGKNSTLKVSLLTEEWKWFRERVGTTRRNNLVFRETVLSTHQVQEGNSSVPFCCHRNWLLVYREIPFDERCLPWTTLWRDSWKLASCPSPRGTGITPQCSFLLWPIWAKRVSTDTSTTPMCRGLLLTCYDQSDWCCDLVNVTLPTTQR